MLRASEGVSDLIFSPGRPPQVEIHGHLVAVQVPRLPVLTADHTRHIASDLIGNNKQAINTLREQGACDVSYGLPGQARFRVNVFIQRGSCAVVMRLEGSKKTPFSALSRGICGVRGHSVILNVPGSPNGAVESLEAVIDILPHALQLLSGNTSHVTTSDE